MDWNTSFNTGIEYNEGEVIKAYVTSYLKPYMTDFERRVYEVARLLMMKEKLRNHEAAVKRYADEIAKESDDVVQAAGVGFETFREQVRQRLLQALATGEVPIKRCPECNRVVRTPLAKQCLWCGQDWHHERSTVPASE